MPDISQINIPNNDGSMTYNLKDANVPHSSLPAASGGTDLSLVTTGEKAEWQDKGNYVIRGTNTTSNTFGHWTGNIPIPELYNGLTITYICSRNTKEVSSCDLELTFPDGSTSGRIEVLFDDGVNVSTEYQRKRCLTLTYIDADHTSWGDPSWVVIAPSVLQWYVDNTEDGNYPLLFSEYAGRVTLNTTNCGAYKDTTFWYNPSTRNLHAEKVNGYTLAHACEKQVDTEVEQSSDNLPTSDAVYNAVNAIHIQTKTASGAIAAFNDASGGVPFAMLKSDISPYQDLHGYSKPWSGGGGKNKLGITATTQTINGITFTIDNEGVITTSGTFSENTNFAVTTNFFLKAGTYILNGCPSGGSYSRYVVRIENGSAQKIALDTGNGEQFTLAEDTYVWCRIYLYSQDGIGKTFKPMVRLATESDSSFAPYSNICPISGFSALNVTRTGVNLWNEQWEQGSINSVTGLNELSSLHWRTNYIKISPTTKYYIVSSTAENKSLRARFYDENKNYIGYSPKSGSTYTNNSFVSPDNAYYVRFAPFASDIPNHDLSLNYPSTDTEYHAYNGQTVTVNFGQTVYGGVADVTNGKLTITHDNIASYNGESINEPWVSSMDTYVPNTIPTTGAQVVYPLATPIEITTTPENLTAISGENNVYGDTNGDTTVEYFSGDCDGIIKLLKALSII